jgi:hypothetical protein
VDETYYGLSKEALKVSADLVAEDKQNNDDHFFKSFNIDDSLYQRRWNSLGLTWIESWRGANSSQLRAVGLFDILGLTFPGFRLKWSTFWAEQEKRRHDIFDTDVVETFRRNYQIKFSSQKS